MAQLQGLRCDLHGKASQESQPNMLLGLCLSPFDLRMADTLSPPPPVLHGAQGPQWPGGSKSEWVPLRGHKCEITDK